MQKYPTKRGGAILIYVEFLHSFFFGKYALLKYLLGFVARLDADITKQKNIFNLKRFALYLQHSFKIVKIAHCFKKILFYK